MTSIDAYIYIIIGLFGVAYPVLLQVGTRLDEKYSSDKIVELFNQEWENKAFRYSLKKRNKLNEYAFNSKNGLA